MLNTESLNQRIRFNSYLFALSNCILGSSLGFYYGKFNFITVIVALAFSVTSCGILALCNYSIEYSRAYKQHLKERVKGVITPIIVGEITVSQLRKRMAVVTVVSSVMGAVSIYLAFGSNIQVLSWFIFICVLSVLVTLFYNVSALYLYRGIGAIAIFFFYGATTVIGSQFLIVAASHASIDVFPDTWFLSVSSGAGALMILYARSLRLFLSEQHLPKQSLVLTFGYKITSIYLVALLLTDISFSLIACVSSHKAVEALLLIIGFVPLSYQVYLIIKNMKKAVLIKRGFNNMMFYSCVNNFVWVGILIIDYCLYY